MTRAILLTLHAFLFGCASIDYSRAPPPDFPVLVQHVFEVESERLAPVCAAPSGPLACAILRFDLNECHIVVPENAPEWLMEHERAHCLGYDHHGASHARDQWERWKHQRSVGQ